MKKAEMEGEWCELHVSQVQQLGPHLAILVCSVEGIDAVLKRKPGIGRTVGGDAAAPSLSAWAARLTVERRRAVVRARVLFEEAERSKRGHRQVHVDEAEVVGWVEEAEEEEEEGTCHELGDKEGREAALIAWLESRGVPLARRRVADVAGGAGRLARLLAERGAAVVLVDPRAAPQEAEPFERQVRVFGDSAEEEAQLLGPVQLVLAMHPDQATEVKMCFVRFFLSLLSVRQAALRFGLARGCSVAVVPCCVYPGAFRGRRFEGGGVTKYGTFVRYLLALDPALRAVRLPFRGRNLCIYRLQE
jgi:hypothetical protein